MSFLVTAVDDDPAALRELFKVVDSWVECLPSDAGEKVANSTVMDTPMTSKLSTPTSSPVSKGKHTVRAAGEGLKKKRTRDPDADVRRRLKRKAERANLEQLVLDLQDELVRLLRAQNSGSTAIALPSPDFTLREAKAINQAMKSQVAKNEMLLLAMNSVISAMTGKIIFTCRLNESREISEMSIRDMYANVHRIASKIPTFGRRSILCCTNLSVSEDGLPQVEMMTGAHLRRDVQCSLAVIAGYFKELCPFGRSVQRCIESTGSATEQGYAMDSPCCDPMSLFASGVVQKHAQGDTVVLVWTSNIVHHSGSGAFLGRAWAILKPSPYSTPETPMTLLQSYYDVSAAPNWACAQDDAEPMRALLVGAMGERVRYKHRVFLRKLLSSTGCEELAATIVV